MFFNNFLPVFSIALTLVAIAGGVAAFRQAKGKQSSEIMMQTIDALKARVETLENQTKSDMSKIAQLIDELAQERRLMKAVRHALARRGLHIEVDEDYVTLVDAQGQQSTQVPNLARVKPVRPVKLQPMTEDDDVS